MCDPSPLYLYTRPSSLTFIPRMCVCIYTQIQVCPWNRWSWPNNQPKTMFGLPSDDVTAPLLSDLMLSLRTDEAFKRRFQGSPIQRIGRARLLRNVAVAMGNAMMVTATENEEEKRDRGEALRVLKEVKAIETSGLVLEHIQWAIERLEEGEEKKDGVEEEEGSQQRSPKQGSSMP